MWEHLVDCFEKQELGSFPAGDGKTRRCQTKNFYVSLYCVCGMPESSDERMVECEN